MIYLISFNFILSNSGQLYPFAITEGFSYLQCLSNAADGVRLAARIVDTPCNEMNTNNFLEVSETVSLLENVVDIIKETQF